MDDVISRNLCDSCINNGCIFQSGIVRIHCDFYKAGIAERIGMTGEYIKMPAQQGWQCPICGRVYSPTTMMCLYCGNEKESISNTYTIDYAHHEWITNAGMEGKG